jgi:hypothetical protein
MIQVGTANSSLAVALPRRSIRSFRGHAVFGSQMRRFGLLISATLVAAALPATARAAAWTQPLDPCYVSVGPAAEQRQLARIRAEGYTPLAPVDVSFDGAPADTTGDGSPDQVYADATGHVRVDVRVPYQTDGERPFAVSVSERSDPANAVSAVAEVTALAVRLRPAQAAPSRRVRFHGRGFIKHTAVWGHYVYRGKLRRTVRLVRRPHGACGTFTVRRRQIPVFRPRTGHWTLQVDQQRLYSPAPNSVFVRLDIDVQRVIRH